MLWLALLGVAIATLYYYLQNRNTYWSKRGVLGPEPNLIFGNLRDNVLRRKPFALILQDFHNYMKERNLRYCGFYQFLTPILMIKDIELLKQIAIKDFDHFTDHQNHSKEDVDLLWSKNLFSIRGEKWRDLRSTLSPAFTGSKMRGMFYLINDCAKRFVDHFNKQKGDIIKVDLRDSFTRMTNDAIATCAFGIQCNSLDDRNNDFYTIGRRALDFTGIRQLLFFMYSSCPGLMKLLGLKIFTNEIASFFTGIISETIKYRTEKGIVRPDMIHLLLEARKGKLTFEDDGQVADSFSSVSEYNTARTGKVPYLTDLDITANALVFFFGGFDTTSYLMCFMSLELALNKHVQDKLREEIEETWAECKGEITYDAIMKMTYLDMVVSETLRKWPIAIFNDRICTKEYTIKAKNPGEVDVTFKEGDAVWFNPYGIHRDPDNYPDPEKYDPERFSAENKSKIKPFTYLPFGEGPRNCIGSRFALMETKAVIVHVLKSFELVPTDKTPKEIKLSTEQLLMTPVGGFHIGLKKL